MRSRATRLLRPLALAAAVGAGLVMLLACSSGSSTRATSKTSFGLQNDFTGIAKTVSPSVVEVATPAGLGSGIVFDKQGDIVTDAHVVGTYRSFTITTASRQHLTGTLVGANPSMDIAAIRTIVSSLTPATFGDSSKLAVGDVVLAFGNP